ncbi:MAG: 3-hydroxyacyl-ACP dehydratase FabZ [Thermodesulfobacteriota bacterium]
MDESLDIAGIMNILPHRYPFLLVDRVTSFEPLKRLTAYKNVTYNEPFFQGHFPRYPIMPGVLIIEALGQAGGLLAFMSAEYARQDLAGAIAYFMALDKVKFRRPVMPGDRLDLKIEVLRQGTKYWKMRGQAFVGETLVAEAEVTALIEKPGSSGPIG